MSFEHDQFYQSFSRTSTASDKCWGEKAWVYEAGGGIGPVNPAHVLFSVNKSFFF